MKANQHGVLICRVCNQNKERRSQVYRGARGDYVLGRVIHRQMVEGVKKLPQSTPLPAPSRKEPFNNHFIRVLSYFAYEGVSSGGA